jgi:two-component system LytT family response regulator
MIRAIIIDDEQHCIDRLFDLINTHFSKIIDVIGTAHSIDTGLQLIKDLKPQLVFLDVQIGKQTGFDLLNEFSTIPFSVIFTTAYEQYAIKAFKFSALDYLLKPIDIDELKIAIEKFQKHFDQNDIQSKFNLLYHNFKQIGVSDKKIAVPTLFGIEFISVSNIIRCESDVNYTTLHIKDRSKLVVAKT